MASGGGSERATATTPSPTADADADKLLSQEWEQRLVTGDLPEDFLQVTDPQTTTASSAAPTHARPAANANASSVVGDMANVNTAFEPELGQLVDVPGAGAGGAARAVANIPTIPSRASKPPELLNRPPATGSGQSASPASPAPVSGGDGTLPSPDQSQQQSQQQQRRPQTTEERDHAMAMALQEQLNMEDAEANSSGGGGFFASAGGAGVGGHFGQAAMVVAPANMVGRLTVTVVEAKLSKNYGLSRMDPYCRVRCGHSVYETPTCANGAKEPKWNKTFNCYLLQGVKNLIVEIFDECTFTTDALVAHGTFPLPESVLVKHEVCDEWFPLSGNEGPDKEGMLHLILSLQPIAPGQSIPGHTRVVQAAGHPGGMQAGNPEQGPAPAGPGQQQQPQPPPPKLTEEELDEFVKMFPNLDKDIILSVFESSRGNKEAMVNSLLQLGQQ